MQKEIQKKANEMTITYLFHPEEKRNQKLYTRFRGLKVPLGMALKAQSVYGSGLFKEQDIFYDPRAILNVETRRKEGKLVLTGRASIVGSARLYDTSVCLVPYGIIETNCLICGRRVSGEDKSGYKKLCEHELALLMFIDDYYMRHRKSCINNKIVSFPFKYV